MLVEFYGHSDDCIEIDVDGKSYDEISGYISNDKSIHSKTLLVTTIGGSSGVKVHVLYDGTWSFAVSQLDDGRSLPEWTFTVRQEHEYSTRLSINSGPEPLLITRENGKSLQEQEDD